jgi:hypothetical protein
MYNLHVKVEGGGGRGERVDSHEPSRVAALTLKFIHNFEGCLSACFILKYHTILFLNETSTYKTLIANTLLISQQPKGVSGDGSGVDIDRLHDSPSWNV